MFALSSSTSKTNALKIVGLPLVDGKFAANVPTVHDYSNVVTKGRRWINTQQPQQTATVPSRTTSLLDAHAFGSTRPRSRNGRSSCTDH